MHGGSWVEVDGVRSSILKRRGEYATVGRTVRGLLFLCPEGPPMLVPVPITDEEKWRPTLSQCDYETWLPRPETAGTAPAAIGQLFIERPVLRTYRLDKLRCVVLFVPKESSWAQFLPENESLGVKDIRGNILVLQLLAGSDIVKDVALEDVNLLKAYAEFVLSRYSRGT